MLLGGGSGLGTGEHDQRSRTNLDRLSRSKLGREKLVDTGVELSTGTQGRRFAHRIESGISHSSSAADPLSCPQILRKGVVSHESARDWISHQRESGVNRSRNGGRCPLQTGKVST